MPIPPKTAQENARKALRWKKQGKTTAMTPVGWTRARQLARGDNLSMNTIKRMAAFVRHKSNSKINPKFRYTPWKDRGYVAWLGWGGDVGINWAIRITKKINKR